MTHDTGEASQAAARGAGLLAHISDETWEQFQEATKQVHDEMNAESDFPFEAEGQEKQKSFAGMWADDKTFDDFVAAMKAYRTEVNNDPNQL